MYVLVRLNEDNVVDRDNINMKLVKPLFTILQTAVVAYICDTRNAPGFFYV